MNANHPTTPRPSDHEVTARWESGFSVTLPFATFRAALGFIQSVYETPASMGRIAVVVAHRIDKDGVPHDAPMPRCQEGMWFHGNGEPVSAGVLPDITPTWRG